MKMPDKKELEKMERTIAICDALLALGIAALLVWLLL